MAKGGAREEYLLIINYKIIKVTFEKVQMYVRKIMKFNTFHFYFFLQVFHLDTGFLYIFFYSTWINVISCEKKKKI